MLQFIEFAALMLPEASRCVTASDANFIPRTRKGVVTATHDSLVNTSEWSRRRKATVTSNVGGMHGTPNPKSLHGTVTSSDGGRSVRMRRYSIPEACRLQGLPENFFEHSPFTAEAKLKAVANGVPLPMGRAIAKAVKAAVGLEVQP